MPRFFKGKLLEDYNVNTNDFSYKKDQVIDVTELESFEGAYAVYYNLPQYNVLDWIPKKIVKSI